MKKWPESKKPEISDYELWCGGCDNYLNYGEIKERRSAVGMEGIRELPVCPFCGQIGKIQDITL